MSTSSRKPTRKQVTDALDILARVLDDDAIALRVGKDIGCHFKLEVTPGRAHDAKFTSLSGNRTERGLAREVINVASGGIRELFFGAPTPIKTTFPGVTCITSR